MPRHDPHPVLDRSAAECLRLLADPELDHETPLPKVDSLQAAALVRASVVHGTLSTAHRHLSARASAAAVDVSDPLVAAFQKAEAIVVSAVGQSMRLRHWGERITGEFDACGVPCAIVKGPVFATRLYPHPSDRFYTDVDIVVPPHAVERAGEILRNLGFVASDIPDRDAADHCEFKWTLKSNSAVQVELQTNLIHASRLRRRISVDYAAISDAGDGDPGDATSLLFVAGVHAALGHQFDRLELLIDVIQAVRERAGPIDTERLIEVSRRTGTLRAVAASLALAGRMYEQPKCTALAHVLMPRGRPIEWDFVSPRVILLAQSQAGRRVSWRRKVFRQLIYRPAPSPRGDRRAGKRA